MADDCSCTCAPGAPVGWRRIPGAGRFGPSGPFGGPGFGSLCAASSNNNNNNNNNNNANNQSSMMGSMMSNLLGLNNMANHTLGGFGFGGLPGFGGFPGFGFPPIGCFPPGFPGFCPPGCGPPGCGCGPGCSCSFCCCGSSGASGPSGPCDPCQTGFCVRHFRIISPEGRECSFPVRVPWWCCPTGTTGATGSAEGFDDDVPDETREGRRRNNTASAQGEEAMSASQLLMQRYAVTNPPRAFHRPSEEALEHGRARDRAIALREQASQGGGPDYGRDYGGGQYRDLPDNIEIIPCPDCDDSAAPKFNEALRDFHKSAVLIPSEEA